MAMDAVLVSDDRTVLCREGATLVASAPSPIAGLIEARSVGIIKVPHLARAPVTLAIDMARIEKTRLPDHHSITLLDIELRCLHKVDASYFPAAIHAYVTGMRKENT